MVYCQPTYIAIILIGDFHRNMRTVTLSFRALVIQGDLFFLIHLSPQCAYSSILQLVAGGCSPSHGCWATEETPLGAPQLFGQI